MKKVWLVAWLLFLALGLVFSAALASPAGQAASQTITLPLVARNNQPTVLPPPSGWLAYLNHLRQQGNLPALQEDVAWSSGCWLHARYMVENGVIAHSEDPKNYWYSVEGDAAARSSNLMVSSNAYTSDETAIDTWLTGPFHGIGLLDPQMTLTGFGSYRNANKSYRMGACMDVIRGQQYQKVSDGIFSFPAFWPGNGAIVTQRIYVGGEKPDPLASCPGYTAPSGPPIYLQIGWGDPLYTYTVNSSTVYQGGTPVEHCVFDKLTYTNPNSMDQSLGRAVLGAREAIILVPRNPLTPGASYAVEIVVDGMTYSWSFAVSTSARTLRSFEGTLFQFENPSE